MRLVRRRYWDIGYVEDVAESGSTVAFQCLFFIRREKKITLDEPLFAHCLACYFVHKLMITFWNNFAASRARRQTVPFTAFCIISFNCPPISLRMLLFDSFFSGWAFYIILFRLRGERDFDEGFGGGDDSGFISASWKPSIALLTCIMFFFYPI